MDEHLTEETLMKKVKYIPWETLVALNDKAIDIGFNRALDPDHMMEVLPYGHNFPIVFDMVHNDTEMRVMFAWTEDGEVKKAMLDMTFEDFDELPVYEMEAA